MLNAMLGTVRIFMLVLLVVFAAGTVARIAGVTAMSVEMAQAEGGSTTMPGCGGCDTGDPGDEGGLTCDTACIAPLAATLAEDTAAADPRLSAEPQACGACSVAGRTGSPEPYPPRTLI